MIRDMDTVKMSYEEMIDTLKGLVFGTFDRTTSKEREALNMAIKALQTEPSTGVIPIPDGATNGDMLTALFGEKVLITLDTHNYLKKWWDTPYTLKIKRED